MKQLNSQTISRERGFTLVELLITLGIFALLFSLGVIVSPRFYGQQSLVTERDTIVALLERSRAKAMNNIHATNHGLHIGDDTYIVYEGDDFISRNTDFDEEHPKSNRITTSGNADITFTARSGNAAPTTVELSLGTASFSISVEETGVIEW